MKNRCNFCAVLSVLILGGLGVLLVYALLHGMEREDKMRDEIRAERCARWGENLPKEFEPYCENLGV